jgi:hypothetical protein
MTAGRTAERVSAAVCSALPLAVLAACGGGGDAATGSGQHAGHGSSGPGGAVSHVDAAGDGRSAGAHGFTLMDVQAPRKARQPGTLSFRILGPKGQIQKEFEVEQTKRMHVYVVQHDLAGFDHVHPEMAADGTWSAPLTLERPGIYRLVTEFSAVGVESHVDHLVLGRSVSVPGDFKPEPLPSPGGEISADGYVLHLLGVPAAGQRSPLEFHVTRDGKDVTDLQPYLDSYAHLTGFRVGNLAAVHLHPEQQAKGGALGGPTLGFSAQFAEPGRYRLFLQFQTAGKIHTAAATIDVA